MDRIALSLSGNDVYQTTMGFLQTEEAGTLALLERAIDAALRRARPVRRVES